MYSDLDVINQALILLGEDELESVNTGGALGEAVSRLYEPTVNALLINTRWRFAMKQAALTQVSGAKIEGYSYGFQLPNDCITVAKVIGAFDFTIMGRIVYANSASLTLNYVFRPATSTWPEHFALAMRYKLATVLNEPVTGGATSGLVMQQFEKEADIAIAQGMALDGQQQPSAGIGRRSRFNAARQV